MSVGRERAHVLDRPFAPASRLGATTTSVGSGIFARPNLPPMQLARELEHVALDERLADVHAGGREHRVGDAAAENELVDLRRERAEHLELRRNLRTADDRGKRPLGLVERAASASSSATSSGPAQAMGA